MRRRRFIVVATLLTAAPFAGAQQDEPGGLLDVRPERVTAEVAPVEAAVGGMPPLPALPIQREVLTASPDAAALPASEVQLPQLPREALIAGPVAAPEERVYFNATLGGGSVNRVLGNINVFRLGEGPQFRLGYDHLGTDGFNFNSPGTGFFEQANGLEAWLQLGRTERLGLELEGSYSDRRFGLQRRPLFYAAETRRLGGAARVEFRPESRLTAAAALRIEDARRILAETEAVDTSPSETHGRFSGEVSALVEWPRLSLATIGDYRLHYDEGTPLDPLSVAGLTLAVEGVPIDGLTLRARAAARYRFGVGPVFPIEGGLTLAGSDRLTLDLSGGLRAEEERVEALWQSYPVATLDESIDGRPVVNRTSFARGEIELALRPGVLRIGGAFDWSRESDRLTVKAYDPAAAVYPIEREQAEVISAQATAALTPFDWLALDATWTGELADRQLGEAPYTARLAAGLLFERIEADVSASVPIDSEPGVPLLETEVRVTLGREVLLTLFADDLIGPLEERGRTPRGLTPSEDDPFIEPGFEIGAAIRVSF